MKIAKYLAYLTSAVVIVALNYGLALASFSYKTAKNDFNSSLNKYVDLCNRSPGPGGKLIINRSNNSYDLFKCSDVSSEIYYFFRQFTKENYSTVSPQINSLCSRYNGSYSEYTKDQYLDYYKCLKTNKINSYQQNGYQKTTGDTKQSGSQKTSSVNPLASNTSNGSAGAGSNSGSNSNNQGGAATAGTTGSGTGSATSGENAGVQVEELGKTYSSIGEFAGDLITTYGFRLAVLASIIIIIYAGIIYMKSGGNSDDIGKAKELIIGVISGMALLLLTSYILRLLIPGI